MGLTPLYHLFVMHRLTMHLKLFAAWVRGLFSRSLTSRTPIELFQSTHLIITGWGSCGMGLHMWIDASHLAYDQCQIYSAFSDDLAWIFGCVGLVGQVHYLDDFLFLELPASLRFFVTEMASSLCTSLGVPLATHETKGPFACLVFLGILVDTVWWELRLPENKIQLLSALIQAWSHRSACQRRELESFLCHLSHTITVI